MRQVMMTGLLAAALGSACADRAVRPAADPGVLFADDFSRFPQGLLSRPLGQLNPAVQEYHYLAHRGVPLEPWSMPIVYLDAWAAGDEDGRTYLEMHLGPESPYMAPKLFSPLFITGDPSWRDVTLEASVRPLSRDGLAGIAFRYRTNRHHYVFGLEGGNRARLAMRRPIERAFRVADWKELAATDFPYETTRYYRLRVENDGPRIRCFVDGALVLSAEDDEIPSGKAGLTAGAPARFRDFRASAADPAALRALQEARLREERALQEENPRPRLWRKFETPEFGCGRNVRFGDLDGDGRPEMVFAQVVSKVDTGNFVEASCVTAVTLEGRVLWEIGRPNPRNTLLTSDTPFQVHDIDGDGRSEVFLVRDFKLQIVEGATGRVRRWAWLPAVPEEYRQKKYEIKERPHELNTGDSICFFDLSGKGRRTEILVKDRYRYFWVYDADLRPLWTGQGQLGHYPYPFDADRDGREEVYIGYAAWSPDGKLLWSRDADLRDHQDAVAVGNFSGDPGAGPRAYYAGSDEGFLVLDLKGNVLTHQRIGHAQNMTVAKLRPDLPGLQIATINFWKNPGILTVFDADGRILEQGEPHHHGSMILPVNWRGDGQEFLLLSGNVREGGMLDGRLRRAVVFPEDGHPDLAAAVLDVTGDARDEVILWDPSRVWVYTQDRPPPGGKLYAPIRNATSNDSNYRAHVSLPAWK
ncbi:MAG TPA: hypothetical protein VNO22_16910 [Planctomycetota bacterium]|nr:hypothetical protein [Planctomycetota bacterium]